MWYHAAMKKNRYRQICSAYLLLMSSVFLLAVSPSGYLNVVETKFAVFCALTGAFVPAAGICFFCGERPGFRRLSAADVLILAYWGWSLLSALCSPWKQIAFLGGNRTDGMITLTLYCCVFLLLSRGGEPDRRLLWAAAAALTVYCLVAALQFFDLNPLGLYPGSVRWSGREREYNGAFLSFSGNADISASVLCTGFALMWAEAAVRRKPLFLLPAAVCIAVMVFSGIRSGLLGALGGLCLCLPCVLPLKRRGKAAVYAALAAVLLLALFLIWLIPLPGTLGELHGLLHGNAEDSFGSGRIYIWKNALRLIGERPLLGGGADTMGRRSLAFERIREDGSRIRRTIDCAHSELLNVAVNQGLPAMLLLLAALAVTLINAFRSGDPASSVLRAALVSYLICGLFGIAMPANAAYFWIVFALLAGTTDRRRGGAAEIDKEKQLRYNDKLKKR